MKAWQKEYGGKEDSIVYDRGVNSTTQISAEVGSARGTLSAELERVAAVLAFFGVNATEWP